ncbi:frataxin homolog, mitochondrial-like isoform X2 [Hylaeus volcanicus]|uniref:frataxin homolog, mitochondrial-like isoform X2 n=1 Tax=Hylaeus volcanicus TaxID=313075 RepID=UPI0023B83989|nr:frataxin homolog, mitochondrial-like isoform X2 [Hylaeus volcanicus]
MIYLSFLNRFMTTKSHLFFRTRILMKCTRNMVKPVFYASEHCDSRFYCQTKRNDQRFFSSKSPHHDLPYQQSADNMLQSMLDFVELPEYMDYIESTNLAGDGVLEIVLNKNRGTIVLNKHYALKQIWYSASNSTPDYFDYDTNPPWISRRTQQSLQNRLLGDIQSSSM